MKLTEATLANPSINEVKFRDTIRGAYRLINAAREKNLLSVQYLDRIEFLLIYAGKERVGAKTFPEISKATLDIRRERIETATTQEELERMRRDYQELCTLLDYSPYLIRFNADTIDMIDHKMWELRRIE